MTPFFITGLPRSRTAWLANWLTTDTTLCYHDVVFKPDLLCGARRVGFSGSELIWQFRDIHNDYPLAPWLHVIREPKTALAAWIKVAGHVLPPRDETFEKLWHKRLDAFLEINCDAVKHVSVEDLDKLDVAQVIWRHLMKTPFDSDRWNILTEFNVQQKLESALDRRKDGTWPQAVH